MPPPRSVAIDLGVHGDLGPGLPILLRAVVGGAVIDPVPGPCSFGILIRDTDDTVHLADRCGMQRDVHGDHVPFG
jgi:hypothetical protein